MSAPVRNPWKTTAVHIAPSQVYVMAVMRDEEYPFEPHTHAQGRALDACMARGWVVVRSHLVSGPYHLTEVGKHVAEVCRAAIAKATKSSEADGKGIAHEHRSSCLFGVGLYLRLRGGCGCRRIGKSMSASANQERDAAFIKEATEALLVEILDDDCDDLQSVRAIARTLRAALPVEPTALTDAQIEAGWQQTFSTNNPFCPCNLKTFAKAARWTERALKRPA